MGRVYQYKVGPIPSLEGLGSLGELPLVVFERSLIHPHRILDGLMFAASLQRQEFLVLNFEVRLVFKVYKIKLAERSDSSTSIDTLRRRCSMITSVTIDRGSLLVMCSRLQASKLHPLDDFSSYRSLSRI